MSEPEQTIPIDDAGEVELPIARLMTGRGFITGKAGAGKSSSVSVIAEELLDRNFPLLIIDTDGEYWGLKEEFELLHVGADDKCDLKVGPEHAEKLADIALGDNVPIILDVSGFLDEEKGRHLILEMCRQLFNKEQTHQKPFPIFVEEIHEYIPQSGGLEEAGRMLIKIGKRGRKRGLGVVGVSQRPADVKKAFISQADWLVWHRLTWDNDTKVVGRVVGDETVDGTHVSDLDDGEAILDADFVEADPFKVQFREKRTFDAGATPDLGDFEPPELKSVGGDLVDELEEISEQQAERQSKLDQLEQELTQKEERIDELETQLQEARDQQELVKILSEAMKDAEAENGDKIDTIEAEVMEVRQQKRELEDEYQALKQERDELAHRVAELESELDERVDADDLQALRDELVELFQRHDDVLSVGGEAEELRERLRNLEAENERLRDEQQRHPLGMELVALLGRDGVQKAVQTAKVNSQLSAKHFDRVLAVLASADGGPLCTAEIEPLTDVSASTLRSVLNDLYRVGILQKQEDGRQNRYSLDRELLESRDRVVRDDDP